MTYRYNHFADKNNDIQIKIRKPGNPKSPTKILRPEKFNNPIYEGFQD